MPISLYPFFVSIRTRPHAPVLRILILALATAAPCYAEQLTLAPYKRSGIYELGEKIGWTVVRSKESGSTTPYIYTYTVKENNQREVATGDLDLSSGKSVIDLTVNEPAMLYLEIRSTAENGKSKASKSFIAGAAVAPTKLRPCVARPADFDVFWEGKINQLGQIPEKAVLTPAESGRPDVEYATIRMDNVNGTHVHGQIAKPTRAGKYPALVIYQWASPPYPLQKQRVTDRAAEGWLALNIEPHDVLPAQPQSYYDALPAGLKKYETIGQDDREKSYFLRMYLGDYRAVDYLTGRPDWDGSTMVVMGISMGGQQSLAVAGLHPKVTHLIVNVPAGCDTNGPLHGRQSSYPFFPTNDPKIMQAALYFDAVNFAPRIKATSLVAMGFVDTISAPTGIWTAFNQIPGPKEVVAMVDSPHNHLATAEQQRPYSERSAEWLDILAKGGQVKPRQLVELNSTRKLSTLPSKLTLANEPTPRADENSKLAHRQLVEKARRGGIDLYFVGDSITRRWGCNDLQYADLLVNWKANFFGWNAGNFGWGGDTTQNILWRLENGELEGVNPKVIVLLAGTNNVGAHPDRGADVADITRGIKDILDLCQQKAPAAKIILTAIFPRNDKLDAMPTINQVNANIAKFADGVKIRFLNVNDKLAGNDDRLFDGMMADKLHPTAKGYQVWADGLKPILTELLGPPASTDHAPPPTGDPSTYSKGR